MRLGRFELPTSCFGGTRSIHLSYNRVAPLYHAFRLGRALSDSNRSINCFHFSVFSVIWGICFSLKANRTFAVANIFRLFCSDFYW